jgi:hypothetical protein
MQPYLPTVHNLLGVAGLAAGLLMFIVLGAMTTAWRTLPEIQLIAGWGLTCLALTTWGVLVPVTLQIPLAALGVVALFGLIHPRLRARIGPLTGAVRLLLLSLPLWLVMLPLRPSQIDTWLNLLPNAAYLFDHGRLPTDAGPPSYSLLPGAPYNTQFVAYVASEASGSLADSAMALFNVALLCASGLLLARVVARRTPTLSWWACALGLLLAMPLNPGFVPRIFFASYGEAPLAVTTMFAVWLAVEVTSDLALGIAWPPATAALALILAALVNIKQSGIGLLLSIGLTLLAQVLVHPGIKRRRGILVTVVALLPALVLALIWRGFLLHHLAAGELKPLPFADWNTWLLPQIAISMAREIYQKATFFLFVAAVLGAAVWQWRRHPWSRRGLLIGMATGVIVLFNAFLVVTYVVLFPVDMAADAHSYFRYASQLSLTVMLALAVTLRPLAKRWLALLGTRARHAAIASVVLILAVPPAIAGMLRFDLDPPQPLLWELGHQVARHVRPGDRVALLLPGDVNDSVGSMLRGLLLFTPPRRPGLDITTETRADAATLDAVAAAGYTLAFVSCTPPGLDDVPPDAAALLRRADGRWGPVAVWPYPADITGWRFAALLARGPLCATTTAAR